MSDKAKAPGGRWGRWCRTSGHPAECSCQYPKAISPGKGEAEVPYGSKVL